MKKILVVGSDSYIGDSFTEFALGKMQVDVISAYESKWKEHSFIGYDSIIHVAGIVHQKQTPANKELYFKVNRDLAVEVAQKAKSEAVGQFIFLSSFSVYGIQSGEITKDTIPIENESNAYGASKLQAEHLLSKLADEQFAVSIIRPPMVYGANSKGNFSRLIKLVKILPFFPTIKNKRSMIYIDNLLEFLVLIISNKKGGVFLPQNEEYINTVELISLIATELNRKVFFISIMNPFVRLGMLFIPSLQSLFDNLYYEQSSSQYADMPYQIVDFKESVKKSVISIENTSKQVK